MRQVGLMIMFISVLSRWITRLIHEPNTIVPSSLVDVLLLEEHEPDDVLLLEKPLLLLSLLVSKLV